MCIDYSLAVSLMFTSEKETFSTSILQCLSTCSEIIKEVKMNWYNKLRYEFAPPVFVIFFTGFSLLIPYFGRDGIELVSLVPSLIGSTFSWTFIGIVFLWAWLWLILERKKYYGPLTTDATTALYKGRGFLYYWATIAAYVLYEIYRPGLSSIIYNSMPDLIGSLNIIAFSLCVFFYILPSQIQRNSNFPKVYIFYRGTEIHLRLLGVDAKQLIISRIGLMMWQLLILAFFIASLDIYGFNFPNFTSLLIQSIYLAKFYYWEKGYYYTLDITLDRIGYYLVWGCLVWVPSFYTFTSFFLASHPPIVSNGSAFLIALFGVMSVLLNYWVDAQKLHFRSSPDGRCVIWGNPAKFIRAKYKDHSGKEKNSLLLISGLWGVARHLNYTFEIATSVFWCLPGLWLGIQPLLYIPFIVILLLHRIFRDEEKCETKYGPFWAQYCEKVPYRLIPNIF